MKESKKKFIFMADDDDDDRSFFQDALSESGYEHELRFAFDGNDLLEQLSVIKKSEYGRLPDVIFLDLNMPVKDGRETLKILKNNPAFAMIPVFIYTTSNSDLDVNLCYSNGANLFITKPSDFDVIVQIIKSVCDLVDKYVILPYQHVID